MDKATKDGKVAVMMGGKSSSNDSCFEKPSMKLMQIVLAGQPQLAERLAKPSMAQLRQRVSFAIRIEPLTRYEIDQYINHRLCVAGYTGLPLFHVGAQALLAERSEGIPRNINNLCFCAMSFAWAMKQERIDRETLRDALSDLDTGSPYQNEVLAPKSPGEVKLSASQTVGRGGLATEGPSGGG